VTDKHVEPIVAGGSPVRAMAGVDEHLVERRLKSELRKLGKDEVPVGLEQRVRRLLQSFTLSADTVPKHH